MKCKCGKEMEFKWCWDDDQITDHCFNLYVCDNCGMIFKDEVCCNFNRWIGIYGNVYSYNKTKKTWKKLK